ncbi:MAG: metallophosphoesterase [Cardiobacteriaceae bacterium]|nr:metallophosphoesterase [Cardiobacteriaceae bacterium]
MGRIAWLLTMMGLFLALVYIFYRGICWSFGLKPSKALCLGFFVPAITLIILAFSRTLHGFHGIFAIFATFLALLWIFAMVSAVVSLASLVSKALWWQQACRTALPVLFVIMVAYAWFNAHSPVVQHYHITLNKPSPKLTIGFVADLHLGNQVGVKEIERLSNIFQQEQVDMVLMPGDIINDDATPYYAQGMDKALKALSSRIPLGVFGTMGNHEFYGNELRNAQALRDGGIQLLRDEIQVVDGKWVIVGRDDQMNRNRATTTELLDELLEDLLPDVQDHRTETAQLLPPQSLSQLPIFLLDHRPDQMLQHADLNIDIQVSGHTHKGQIFPANFITQKMYPLHHGYAQWGNGHFFTTSGYGFWGVPLRLGSRSEVVIMHITGKE